MQILFWNITNESVGLIDGQNDRGPPWQRTQANRASLLLWVGQCSDQSNSTELSWMVAGQHDSMSARSVYSTGNGKADRQAGPLITYVTKAVVRTSVISPLSLRTRSFLSLFVGLSVCWQDYWRRYELWLQLSFLTNFYWQKWPQQHNLCLADITCPRRKD